MNPNSSFTKGITVIILKFFLVRISWQQTFWLFNKRCKSKNWLTCVSCTTETIDKKVKAQSCARYGKWISPPTMFSSLLWKHPAQEFWTDEFSLSYFQVNSSCTTLPNSYKLIPYHTIPYHTMPMPLPAM